MYLSIVYHDIQLIPLEFKSEAASVLEEDSRVNEDVCMSAGDVISKHSGPNGCIAFAVRRPGGYNALYSIYCIHTYVSKSIIYMSKCSNLMSSVLYLLVIG